MPAAIVATAFEDIEEPVEIGFSISMRFDQRITDARLGREMNDEWKTMFCEQRRCGGVVCQIEPHEFEVLVAGELLEPRLFKHRVVIRRQVIDADHFAPGLDQAPRGVEADEAGGTGDQDGIY